MVAAIDSYHADVCVLAEYRAERRGELTALLGDAGFATHVATTAAPHKNGLLVATRLDFLAVPPPAGLMYQQRWIELDIPAAGMRLLACHVPPKISIGVEQKTAFWDTLLNYARQHIDANSMIIGDLNTGAPHRDEHRSTLYCAEHFEELGRLGWVDAWRKFHGPTKKEWTWTFPSRPSYGYRLDHAFCSPGLANRLQACSYSHAERLQRLSDHSILILDLNDP
jgi:exonuclease III